MRRILPLAAIGLVISFCTCAEALGSSPVGTVIALRGTAMAVDSQEGTRELALKDPVYLQDTVKTEKRSKIQVMFTDNTIVSLGPEAEMKISEYEWKPDENTGSMKTRVKEGVFRLMGGSIAKTAPENFTTETPAATIGIRGSMYAGSVSGDSLTVLFQGGKGIFVTNAAGTVHISVPGFGTMVENRLQAPKPPEKFTVEQIAVIDQALSGGDGGSEPENGKKPSGSDRSGSGKNSGSSDSEEGRESETPESGSGADENRNDSEKKDGEAGGKPGNRPPEGENPGQEGAPSDGGDTLTARAGSGTQDAASQQTAPTERLPSNALVEPLGPLTENSTGSGTGLAGPGFNPPDSTFPIMPPTDTLAIARDATEDAVQQDLDTTARRSVDAASTTTTEPPTTTTLRETTTTEAATTTTTTTIAWRETTTTLPVHEPVIATFTSGRVLAIQTDSDAGTTTGDAIWSGMATATSTDGRVEGGGKADEDGKEFPYAFSIRPYDSSATYTGPSSDSKDRPITLNSQEWTFVNGIAVKYGQLGEFAYYLLPKTGFNATYFYQELGFVGIPSNSVPSDGVDNYIGEMMVAITEANTLSSASAQFSMEINWLNQKVLGRVTEDGDDYYFFGDLSGTELVNVRFCGGKGGSNPDATTGSATFSQIYGSQHQGFGMTATGVDKEIQTQADLNSGWKGIAAGFREDEISSASPTANVQWSGFFTGLSENMAAPATDRRLYLNSAPGQFQLSIDKSNGAIAGNFSGTDLLGSNYQISNIEVGGTNDSAFILDDNLIAEIGDGGANVIVNGGDSGGLSNYGNFLVSAPPEAQFSSYVTWGYWEAAYVDPTTSAAYHIHKPGTYWIAGEQTPVAYIQGLINDATFVGNYTGPAYGIRIDANPSATALTGGATNLTVDFSKVAVNDAVTGSITFNEIGFTVASNPGAITSSGFTANFSNSTGGAVASSAVNGAFFGPAANAVGGNFNAQVGGDRYMGIFGGNR